MVVQSFLEVRALRATPTGSTTALSWRLSRNAEIELMGPYGSRWTGLSCPVSGLPETEEKSILDFTTWIDVAMKNALL